MKIKLNNKDYNIPDHSTLSELIEISDLIEKTGIAVAVNNKVVRKKDWNAFSLQENDKILIIRAAQGG